MATIFRFLANPGGRLMVSLALLSLAVIAFLLALVTEYIITGAVAGLTLICLALFLALDGTAEFLERMAREREQDPRRK